MDNALLKVINIAVFVFLLAACTPEPEEKITIAISPWPGYEFLYLAEKKGFFKQVGLNISLVQMGALADSQRAYVNGHVDGMASTIIEAVQAEPLGGKPLKIVLVPDYSNGGDVIITNKTIKNLSLLKGRNIGCEVASLGIYLLERALAKHNLKLTDVNVRNVEQLDGKQYLMSQEIDAFVTYPPVSVEILKDNKYHTVFSSSEIPYEIVDTVSISNDVLRKNPDLVPKLHMAWQMAIDYSISNEHDAYSLMAKREGISVEDFKEVITDLKLQDIQGQKEIFSDPDKFQRSVVQVCNTLVHVDALSTDCNQYTDIIYRGLF